MKTGHTIRLLRTAKKVSQGNLARHLDVTPGYLSLVEQDKREPSLGFLHRVGKYFELPVGFLLLGNTSGEYAVPEHQELIKEIKRAMFDFIVARPDGKKRENRRAGKK